MLQTRSNVFLVAQVNTVAGGSVVTISNSGGLFAMQSGTWTVGISNSAGWLVGVGSTSIVNSAGWIVSVSNTAGITANIINSAGWIVAISNTSPLVSVQNSAGWIFAQSNTSPLVSVENSAGWIVNVANTGGVFNIVNSAGWVVAQANTSPNVNLTQIIGNAPLMGIGNSGSGSFRFTPVTATSITSGQVFCGSAATLIIAQNSSRLKVTIINNGTGIIYLGNANITVGNGQYMPGIAGYPIPLRTSAAIYGITVSTALLVSYLEEF